jgi:hypothetical protein
MLDPIDIARGVMHVAGEPSFQGGFFAVGLGDKGRTLSRVSDSPEMTPAESSPF